MHNMRWNCCYSNSHTFIRNIRNNLTGSFDSFVAKLNLIAGCMVLNILDDHDFFFHLRCALKIDLQQSLWFIS